ncbi:hypothetical protein LINGRAHAP2_LOCUS23583 [Linum grandiflorum]
MLSLSSFSLKSFSIVAISLPSVTMGMASKQGTKKRMSAQDKRSPKKKSRTDDAESASKVNCPIFRCKTKGVVHGNNLIAYRAKGHRIKKLLYEAGFSGFLEL